MKTANISRIGAKLLDDYCAKTAPKIIVNYLKNTHLSKKKKKYLK